MPSCLPPRMRWVNDKAPSTTSLPISTTYRPTGAAPSPVSSFALGTTLVQSATAWTATYAAIDREKKYQKYLHTWITGEGWLEDLPTPFESRASRTVLCATLRFEQYAVGSR